MEETDTDFLLIHARGVLKYHLNKKSFRASTNRKENGNMKHTTAKFKTADIAETSEVDTRKSMYKQGNTNFKTE